MKLYSTNDCEHAELNIYLLCIKLENTVTDIDLVNLTDKALAAVPEAAG